jgi:hypothetical protein
MTREAKIVVAVAASAALTALAALTVGASAPASAQYGSAPGGGGGSYSTPTPLIEVNPRPLYRRCSVRYVVQYRPSGTVLFPDKHCWWQRGRG